MEGYVTFLMTNFGYFGMFLGMVLEAVIIIIPSEVILATGGILAGRGIFSFWMAFCSKQTDFGVSPRPEAETVKPALSVLISFEP